MKNYVVAIIVAAGSSTRMGGISKQLIKLNGTETIAHTILAFQKSDVIDEIIVVTKEQDISTIKQIAKANYCSKAKNVVIGGNSRQESVQNGIGSASKIATHFAIHDGARPLITPAVIEKTVISAFSTGASATGVPVKDTIKVVHNGIITDTPNRESLIAIQTPQVFEKQLYLKAVKNAKMKNKDYTDDCKLIESINQDVTVVIGDYNNIKLTTPEDITIAESILNSKKGDNKMRIGHGYDVHRLVENRPLILGGVNIKYEKGLLGHSDADVLLHAIMDALLGAAALGDIGKLFPDTDPKFKGADSILLLKYVVKKINEKGYKIVNIDSTIIAQKPKLMADLPLMRINISNACGIDIEDVNVKATTEEKLGFTGSGEGISAHAVCLIE